MLRCFPPVGHSIQIGEILNTLLKDRNESVFLEKWISNLNFHLVSSGSTALTLSLQSISNISKRTEVLLPAYTCPSLVASVVRAGLEPVLCDLKPFSFQLDLESLSSKIGHKTLAVMAVHLFGIPENIVELKSLTIREGVFLIEDAAQAFGNKIDDGNLRYLGLDGDLSVLSFGRGKPMSLLSGGAVIVNNPDLNKSVDKAYRTLKEPSPWFFLPKYFLSLFLYSIFYHPRMHWFPRSLPWLRIGDTFFILDFDIKKIGPKVINLGNILFEKFGEIRKIRLDLTKLYKEKLETFRDAFEYFPDYDSENIALLRFPIIFRKRDVRDRILASLEKNGLGVTGSFPVPLNELEGAATYLNRNEYYPNAKAISERILTLPLHEYVTTRDVENIVKTVVSS